MAAFIPGASPPEVNTPILLTFLLPMFFNLFNNQTILMCIVYTEFQKYEFEST
jgi:hypothetical protein